jgi:hypothetical protein
LYPAIWGCCRRRLVDAAAPFLSDAVEDAAAPILTNVVETPWPAPSLSSPIGQWSATKENEISGSTLKMLT